MLLKNQVTSLGLSKRLKELGVKQESFFWWYAHREMQTNKLIEWRIIQHNASSNESCSAFTVAELGRYMPTTYLGDLVSLIPNKTVGGYWRVDLDDEGMLCSETTEADARAKLLIYLLENNLIKE